MSSANGAGLFSIDVDAHLKKAASHTFGSPSHYPVELVRAALGRGASKVEVELGHKRIKIQDNGSGMNGKTMEILIRLLDPAKPEAVREEAVETLHNPGNFGLLAIFASSPAEIQVENVSAQGSDTLRFRAGRLKRSDFSDWGGTGTGTRITMVTDSQRDTAREKQILQVYCKSVRQEIYLGKQLISGGPLLAPQMAHLKIKHSPLVTYGDIGVPPTGDMCRLRLLDRGIPYRYVTLPAHRGFIFDAAAEYRGEITRKFMDHLADYAFRLYKWLCEHHADASPLVRERIEELVFTHNRLTQAASLFDHFAPFKRYRSSQSLTLPQIINMAGRSAVYAVPLGKEKLRYNTTGKKILALTQEQADFLINQQNLAVTFLSPVLGREKILPKVFHVLKKLVRAVIVFPGALFYKKQLLAAHQLSPSEQDFLDALNFQLQKRGDGTLSGIYPVAAVLHDSKGPYPSIPAKEGSKASRPLLIRRRHPLVKKAVKIVHQTPENIEIVMPLVG